MPAYTIRPYQPADAPQIAALQAAYARAFPGVTVQDAGYIQGFYGHPAFDGGQNIFCATGAEGTLLGYGLLYAKPPEGDSPGARRYLFLSIQVDPTLGEGDTLRAALYARLVERARAIAAAAPQWQTMLQAALFSFETPAIAFLMVKGLARYGGGLLMSRSLAEAPPDLTAPKGVEVRASRLETDAEQLAYLRAHNEALPGSAMDLEGLRYFMGSPMWAVSTAYLATAGDQVVGGALAYWNEDENRRMGEKVGSTEEVFVLAPWRRQGIARYLIAQAMRYLREHGLDEARLEMAAENEAALALYRSLGYRVIREQVFLHGDL